MLSKVLTYLRIAVLSLICGFAILLITLILINSKDTTKSSNTLTLEQWALQTVIPDADNGFLFSQQLTGTLPDAKEISLTPEHNRLFMLYETACHEGELTDCLAFYRHNAFNIPPC